MSQYNSFVKFINDIHDLTPLEGINRCVGSDIVAEMNLESLTLEIVNKIKDILFMKVIYEQYSNENRLIVLKEKFKVSVNIGNNCLHECFHCLIDGGRNGTKFHIDEFRVMLNKYASKLKYVHTFFFTGGELLDRKDFPLFIEELLKRRVNNIKFVSRGGLANQSQVIKDIQGLKKRYPNFQVDLTLSLDNQSDICNKNQKKHVERLSELLIMQFELFGKDRMDFISTLPLEDTKEANKGLRKALRIMDRICFKLEAEGYKFLKHEIIKGVDTFYFNKGEKEYIIGINYQMLAARTNRSKNIKGAGKALDREDCCKFLDHSENTTFYVDDRGNLNYCSHIAHGNDFDKGVINLKDASRNEVLKTYFDMKRKFYSLLTPEEIIDYVINPENKLLCSKLRKDLSLTRKSGE